MNPKEKKLYPQPKKLNDLPNNPSIKGLDVSQNITIASLISSFATTGIQASNVAKGVEILKAMKREKATVFLTCTSNIITSGLRDIITYLVKEKIVDVIVTSAGGVEEDIMKVFGDFKLGSFDSSSKVLFDNGIFRAGNIFIPNTRYAYLEKCIDPFLKKLYLNNKKIISTHMFIKELGLELESYQNKESSYIYWASKNEIPVFCPGLIDGSIGDMISFFKYNHKDFYLDSSDDIVAIDKIALDSEKTGVICLGGGLPKHFVLNAQILREGADFAIYVSTAEESDGCDSGAKISEAQTWSKIKHEALHVKIHSEASIAFPILIAGFLDSQKK